MYKQTHVTSTSIKRNDSYEGERIEEKVARIVNNKEPITDGAPQIYTKRTDGVLPEYDIRTDRFEIAVEAMDHVEASNKAKREQFHKDLTEKNNPKKKDGGAEPIQGTESK